MTRDADLMCVDVSADAFAAGLRRVAPVIPRASTLPVLACVLCEATTDGLLLSGTDLNVAASTVVPARVHTPGAVAVPARRLRTLLRTLARRSAAGEPAGWELGRGTSGAPDDGAASLRLQVRSVGADGLRLEIGYGTLHTRLRGRPSDEFPALPAPRFDECWRVTSAQLRQLVHQTAFAASTDERRPILNGVLWELRPERTRMVATDGHRLARAEVLTPGSASTRRAADLIVQPPALDRMRRLFPADTLFEVAHGDNHLGIRSGEAVAYTRLIEGPYPDYERVIPTHPDRIAVADRERLALGIRRMDPLGDEPLRPVWLTLRDGQLRFGRVHPRVRPLGGMTDQMTIDYRGTPLDVGFTSAYVLDALHRIATPAVRLRLGEPGAGVIFEPDMGGSPSDYLYVVMPLREPE